MKLVDSFSHPMNGSQIYIWDVDIENLDDIQQLASDMQQVGSNRVAFAVETENAEWYADIVKPVYLYKDLSELQKTIRGLLQHSAELEQDYLGATNRTFAHTGISLAVWE